MLKGETMLFQDMALTARFVLADLERTARHSVSNPKSNSNGAGRRNESAHVCKTRRRVLNPMAGLFEEEKGVKSKMRVRVTYPWPCKRSYRPPATPPAIYRSIVKAWISAELFWYREN